MDDARRRRSAGRQWDRDALDRRVRDIQGDLYGLALRMLWNREDAEDATQEIPVRVVTRLAQVDFRSGRKPESIESPSIYILDVRKSPVERTHSTRTRPMSAAIVESQNSSR